MADTMTRPVEDHEYERDSIPSEEYRAALVALLGAHAIPVWGWGQRDHYAAKVMDGPSLDQWVLTSNLWAEEERDIWEWEQLVHAVTAESFDSIVGRTNGALATSTPAAIEEWIDLVALCACVDSLGEELVRTFTDSTYGPLKRHARLMVMYKRGQAADGISALRQGIQRDELAPAAVDDVLAKWLAIAREHAALVASSETEADWIELGIATSFDADAAISRVEARFRQHLKE